MVTRFLKTNYGVASKKSLRTSDLVNITLIVISLQSLHCSKAGIAQYGSHMHLLVTKVAILRIFNIENSSFFNNLETFELLNQKYGLPIAFAKYPNSPNSHLGVSILYFLPGASNLTNRNVAIYAFL
jgi:hypothetical protein